MIWLCRICGLEFPHSQRSEFLAHVGRCADRNADVVEAFRPKPPFVGDPEMLAFAAAEGDVYRRRAGTRKQPR